MVVYGRQIDSRLGDDVAKRSGRIPLFGDQALSGIENLLFSFRHCQNSNERLNYMFESNVCQ